MKIVEDGSQKLSPKCKYPSKCGDLRDGFRSIIFIFVSEQVTCSCSYTGLCSEHFDVNLGDVFAKIVNGRDSGMLLRVIGIGDDMFSSKVFIKHNCHRGSPHTVSHHP